MHILFAHKTFPAHFRYIMPYLVSQHGARCTFVSEKMAVTAAAEISSTGIERIPYKPRFQASRSTSYCGRSHENQMWASQAIVESLASRKDLQPDLIVAHSGFFTSSFLRELYDCPIVNLFEYFYHPTGSDCDFRSDLVQPELIQRIRTRARNSSFLLDLECCDHGYCPTEWQRSRFPASFQGKLSAIHDGIDADYWQPSKTNIPTIPGVDVPTNMKVITYVTRGFESLRGFDIFMKVAKRICDMRQDVVFLVAGSDRVVYGPDRTITGGSSFKDWVLEQDDYDLERIRFLGYVPKETIRAMYQRSNLHIYLTAPFILSWSPLDAMSCGGLVLGSDTSPVQEAIQHGQNGLLCDFFNVEQMVWQANHVLDNPDDYVDIRTSARRTILSKFDIQVSLPRITELYQRVASGQQLVEVND